MTDDEQVDQVRAWFAEKGFDLSVERRDMATEVRGLTARHEYWVDLVSRRTGEVSLRSYGSGPTPTLAIVATEQRWLSEEDGRGSVAGATYVHKAGERLRRGRDRTP